jgi:putative SOS response-associated peptidase YedK
MCNLYRMTKGVDEIARLFAVEPDRGANFAEEVYPGYPGLVVAEGRVRAMNWGFPLILTGKQGQKLRPKPVTNAREDKLHTTFWRDSFARRRCLIPVSAWAEPQGKPGQMTRSWYSLPGGEPFAVAGLWRASAEWGEVYTLVMAQSSPQMAEVHDRMPVILAAEDWSRWTEGTPEQAFALCRTWPSELIADHTAERWAGGDKALRQPGLI